MILTSPNPFAFTGKVVEKTGPDHYVVYDGTITTCELPRPKWEFNAHKIVVEVGGNATIYHSTFRIRGRSGFLFSLRHPSGGARAAADRVSHSQCRQLFDQGNDSWESQSSGPLIAAWTSLREPNISPGAVGRRRSSFAPSPAKSPMWI